MDFDDHHPIFFFIFMLTILLVMVSIIPIINFTNQLTNDLIDFFFFEDFAIVIQKNYRSYEVIVLTGGAVTKVLTEVQDRSEPKKIEFKQVRTQRSRGTKLVLRTWR